MSVEPETHPAIIGIWDCTQRLRNTVDTALSIGIDPLDCVKAALEGWGTQWSDLSTVQRLMITNACKTMVRVERWSPVTEVQT